MRGIVSGRVASLWRSVEIQPCHTRFVPPESFLSTRELKPSASLLNIFGLLVTSTDRWTTDRTWTYCASETMVSLPPAFMIADSLTDCLSVCLMRKGCLVGLSLLFMHTRFTHGSLKNVYSKAMFCQCGRGSNPALSKGFVTQVSSDYCVPVRWPTDMWREGIEPCLEQIPPDILDSRILEECIQKQCHACLDLDVHQSYISKNDIKAMSCLPIERRGNFYLFEADSRIPEECIDNNKVFTLLCWPR